MQNYRKLNITKYKLYQELIEVDTVSHIFKNISFNDAMSHISHWNALLYILLLKWKFLLQRVPMILILIHAHAHPPWNMVHVDHVIMTGLVLLLDHPEDMIMVIHLDMIILIVMIITISDVRGMVII